MRRPVLLVGLAAVSASLLAACGGGDDASPAARPSVTTVKNCTQDVRIEAPIERAVAINQPAVEMLLSLGLQDRIAGAGVSDNQILPALKPLSTPSRSSARSSRASRPCSSAVGTATAPPTRSRSSSRTRSRPS